VDEVKEVDKEEEEEEEEEAREEEVREPEEMVRVVAGLVRVEQAEGEVDLVATVVEGRVAAEADLAVRVADLVVEVKVVVKVVDSGVEG
jgi:hypothetical protein